MSCKRRHGIRAAGLLLLTALSLSSVALAAAESVGRVDLEGYLLAPTQESLSAETALGDLCADALRAAANTDVALLGSGALKAAPPRGEVTRSQLENVFREDEPIETASVTARALAAYLEAALSHIAVGKDDRIDREASAFEGFPQISGFTLCYDASAPAGERLVEIETAGKVLKKDGETVLTLAAPRSMLDGSLGLPVLASEDAGCTLSGALCGYVAAGGAETVPTPARIRVRGVADNVITGSFPVGIVAGLAAVFCLFVALLLKNSLAFQDLREKFGKPREHGGP